MAEKRDILWRFLGDSKDLQKASKGANRALADTDKSTGRLAGGLNSIEKGFAAVGGAYAVSKVADFAVDAADMAEQAEIAGGAANKVLGPAADDLRRRFEDLRGTMGFNSAEFDTLIAKQGLLVTGMGASQDSAGFLIGDLIDLGGDLASFSGEVGNTTGAIDAVGAAIRGEFDPLEQWGVKLKESGVKAEIARQNGLDPLFAALGDGEQRLIAIRDLITKGAAPAIGALGEAAETSAGLANDYEASLEDLQIRLGQKLAPAIKAARENNLKLVDSLLTLTDDTAAAGEKAGAFASAWDATAGQFGVTSDELLEELRMWGEALGVVESKTTDTTAAVELLGLGGAVAGDALGSRLNPSLAEMWLLSKDAAQSLDDAADAVGDLNGEMGSTPQNWNPFANVPANQVWVDGSARRGTTGVVVGTPGAAVGRHAGGIVPGARGTPQTVKALGGERFTAPGGGGGGGTVVNINIGVAGDPYQTAQVIADLLTEYEQTNGTRISGVSS